MRFLGGEGRELQIKLLASKAPRTRNRREEILSSISKETTLEPQIWALEVLQKYLISFLYHMNVLLKLVLLLTKNFLQEHKHPVVQMIARAREINKAHTTFIDTILRHEHKGRIHADINQIRSDQGGTVTGRFSYSILIYNRSQLEIRI